MTFIDSFKVSQFIKTYLALIEQNEFSVLTSIISL